MAKREFPKSATNILAPKFEYIPDELKTRPFWCCWKEIKKPTRIKSGQLANGSINVPSDWLTFDQSVQIYVVHSGWGIGMLLNGDGLITIDIDGCVHNGEPSPESLAVMREHGVGYVEFSPSGTGLHGYGLADLSQVKKTRFTLCGVNVEIYSHSRFMTVTGHVLWNTGITELPLLVKALHAYATEDAEDKEDIECNSSVSSNSSVASIKIMGTFFSLPRSVIPQGLGERNSDLFSLARFVKGIAPELSKVDRRDCVDQWHRQFLDVIATKEFAESFSDFETAWRKVKHPYGETLARAIHKMHEFEPPDVITEMGKNASKLFRLCMSLSAVHAPEPFFVSCRVAAGITSCNEATVSRRFDDFIELGLLVVVEKHTPNRARRLKLTYAKQAVCVASFT